MPLIADLDMLGCELRSLALASGVQLAHDTHYDAKNWELSWWRGSTLTRLDFQPLSSSQVVVVRHDDYFPLLPRFSRWAHNAIPLFPNLARSRHTEETSFALPVDASLVRSTFATVREA